MNKNLMKIKKTENGTKTIKITQITFKRTESLTKYMTEHPISSLRLKKFQELQTINNYMNVSYTKKNYLNFIKINNFFLDNSMENTCKMYSFLSPVIENKIRKSFVDIIKIICLPRICLN